MENPKFMDGFRLALQVAKIQKSWMASVAWMAVSGAVMATGGAMQAGGRGLVELEFEPGYGFGLGGGN